MTQQPFDLALQQHTAGRLSEAERMYRQILLENPAHAGALHYLGVVAHQVGREDAAEDLIRRSLAIDPASADAHNNLGDVLHSQGRFDEAMAVCRQAIALEPGFPEAHSNLGNALKGAGELEQAVAAYRRATELRPNFAQAHYNLGVALNSLARLDESIAALKQALSINPKMAGAHSNLGSAMKDRGEIDQAVACFRQALELRPGWIEAHSNLMVVLKYHPDVDDRAMAVELQNWDRLHAGPLRKLIQPHVNDRDPDRRLRIGYVSPDFREHVVGRNILPLFRNHDRGTFHVTCYSRVKKPDELTRQFQQNCHGWRDIIGMPDDKVAAMIREDRIDLLVDLSLHTANNSLMVFARKPAPVQVTFAGYPGSTGLGTMDYRLSDPYLDPPGMDESVYSEQTIRLPHSFWCYDPLDCRDIPVSPLPALHQGTVTFGCLNNFCKINDRTLSLFARVMREAPRSRLMLLAKPGSHRQRAIDLLGRDGIDPARIEFVSWSKRPEYLRLYHRIDLGLDSFPYNGHTTSLDSFWMGVPVVTWVGKSIAGRAGWSQLSNLGLTELAGDSQDDFVRIAATLANDLPRLAELRRTLRRRMERSPLMDAMGFARGVEAAYRAMWRRWVDNAVSPEIPFSPG